MPDLQELLFRLFGFAVFELNLRVYLTDASGQGQKHQKYYKPREQQWGCVDRRLGVGERQPASYGKASSPHVGARPEV